MRKLGKRGKIGKKRQNQEGSFTLPLLTDTAGYAIAYNINPVSFPWLSVTCVNICSVTLNIEPHS